MTIGGFIKRVRRTIRDTPFLGPLLRSGKQAILRRLPKSVVLWLCQPKTDWKKLEREFERFLSADEKRVVETARTPQIIVSLTSYPARIPRIHYTVFTLLRQTLPPDRVVLWLAEEQFPNGNDDLPPALLALLPYGLTIRYTRDIKSYKKLVPALDAFPEDIIVTVDDDFLYEPGMLERLYRSYHDNNDWIHAYRAHRITMSFDGKCGEYADWNLCIGNRDGDFRNFLTSGGGVLFPPHALHKDVGNERLFMELSPSADDIWFWAMAVVNGTKICVVNDNVRATPNHSLTYEEIVGIGASGLMATNVFGGQNDVQFNRVIDRYPVILERLTPKRTR